jgi:hypothetical protein
MVSKQTMRTGFVAFVIDQYCIPTSALTSSMVYRLLFHRSKSSTQTYICIKHINLDRI